VIISQPELESFVHATQSRPHDFLGVHLAFPQGRRGVVARAFLPDAARCELVVDGADCVEMERLHGDGFFEGFAVGREVPQSYRLRVTGNDGVVREIYDAYAFPPSLNEGELRLFGEGRDPLLYEKLGARVTVLSGVPGVVFAVWAPNARRVSVVGDFNRWDGRYQMMRNLGASGVWELFIPGLGEGVLYKYEILGVAAPVPFLKSDPFAVCFESPPHNAAIVRSLPRFPWRDAAWVEARATTDWGGAPVSIYEMHLGSWRRVAEEGGRPLSYREIAAQLPPYLREMGFTHVEFLPLSEHPFDGSWGYQVTGFFAPTRRFGDAEDFMFLVDALHAAGIGVIVDWVPAHFPRDAFALPAFDGTCLYEHADPRQGAHQEWGTLVFNHGRNEVRNFLAASALAWFDRFHVDGLRVDAVASMLYLDYSRKEGEWVPNKWGGRENLESIAFLRYTNSLVHQRFPGAILIAEESTSFAGVTRPVEEGGLGFDLKWNMGWMHDSLAYFRNDPLLRKYHHDKLTFGMLYQYSEKFVQVFSHDEVVHGKASMLNKMPQPGIAERARNLRAFYAFMWAWPGKKTLFMGCEFGQYSEWNHAQSLDWHLLQYIDHEGIRRVVRDLNKLYCADAALAATEQHPAGFEWVDVNDAAESVLAFLRCSADASLCWLVVCNFTPVERTRRFGVPHEGEWREVLNTDALEYGGSGNGNLGGVIAHARCGSHGRPHSVQIRLPGMSTIIFRHQR
jgi:1,4-alpha-glucan branching enzyme